MKTHWTPFIPDISYVEANETIRGSTIYPEGKKFLSTKTNIVHVII